MLVAGPTGQISWVGFPSKYLNNEVPRTVCHTDW